MCRNLSDQNEQLKTLLQRGTPEQKPFHRVSFEGGNEDYFNRGSQLSQGRQMVKAPSCVTQETIKRVNLNRTESRGSMRSRSQRADDLKDEDGNESTVQSMISKNLNCKVKKIEQKSAKKLKATKENETKVISKKKVKLYEEAEEKSSLQKSKSKKKAEKKADLEEKSAGKSKSKKVQLEEFLRKNKPKTVQRLNLEGIAEGRRQAKQRTSRMNSNSVIVEQSVDLYPGTKKIKELNLSIKTRGPTEESARYELNRSVETCKVCPRFDRFMRDHVKTQKRPSFK